MYGKSFESKFEGSMVGAGFHVYSVWDYCITKNRSGFIELNPKLLAFVLDGGKPESEMKVAEAIEFLSLPDPKSRNKTEDGRRLVKEGEYQYRMVNWQHYESIKSIADLREYNRRKQAEYRARKAEAKRAKKSGPLKGEAAAIAAVENGTMTQEEADEVAARTREG
jgi:hypothetical protein